MANEFRKVKDASGVFHPVTDDTRVTWSANAVLGAKNLFDINAYKQKSGATIENNKFVNTSTDTGENLILQLRLYNGSTPGNYLLNQQVQLHHPNKYI